MDAREMKEKKKNAGAAVAGSTMEREEKEGRRKAGREDRDSMMVAEAWLEGVDSAGKVAGILGIAMWCGAMEGLPSV